MQDEEQQKRLLIHVGHPKTGTSALQSFFSAHHEALSQVGVAYPLPENHALATQGGVTSGNGGLLMGSLKALNPTDEDVVLYSSELLFESLVKDPSALQRLTNSAKEQGLKVEIILYLRDFFDLTASVWGQYIKRGLGTKGYASYTQTETEPNNLTVSRILDLILLWQSVAANTGSTVRFFNYDRCRKQLISHFLANVLERSLPQTDLTIPDK